MSRRSIMESEPNFSGKTPTDAEVAAAYNWYRENCELKQAKAWTLEYMASAKMPDIAKISKTKDQYFGTLGWIARMCLKGAVMAEHTMAFFQTQIDSLADKIASEAE